MIVFFWLSVFLVLFSYAIYPVLLKILAIGKKPNRDIYAFDELPSVSVIIAAYNEEVVIGEKIQSVLDSSYPVSKLEILVGSDASTDTTASVVKQFGQPLVSISCFDFPVRRGKPSVVNDLVSRATGEILVLTDANVIFSPDTLLHLIRHFKNPSIGLVDTNMVNRGLKPAGISNQEKAYISREVKIKNLESLVWGAMMGPFGGCYAIRRNDFSAIPANSLVDDFYVNMKILESGQQAVNELNAIVYEEALDSPKAEFRRKARIATGNFQNLKRFAHLLWPPWQPIGFAFLSHKVLRWFGPIFLILAFTLNIPLAMDSNIYFATLLAQSVLMFLVPLLDQLLRIFNIHCSLLRMIVHFYNMNLALLVGMIRYLRGVNSGVWSPTPRKSVG